MSEINKQNSGGIRCSRYLDTTNPTFSRLMQQVERIQLFDQIFTDTVSTELAKHCRVINLHGESLVISAEHAHWATRLRYNTPEILSRLTAYPEIPPISAIRVVICPATPTISSNNKAKASISEEVSRQLKKMSENIDDEDIANCLQRISQHH